MTRSQAKALALAAALLLGLLALWTATPARGATADPGPSGAPDGDVVVLLAQGAGEAKAEQAADGVSGEVVAAIPQIGAYLVDLPSESAAAQSAAAATLEDAAAVREADPTQTVGLADASPLSFDDPYLSSEWHLGTIRAGEAWALTTGDPGVVIAVVDTGVDYGHPDLAGKVILGADVADGDADPMDTYGHGTHVAGIAAATAGNGVGVAGVCPRCTILAVKVFADGSGSTSDFTVAQGIVWAVDHGANVVNLSLGGPGSSAVAQAAVDYAWSRGVVVVAAAGNSASSTLSYPAAYPSAIAVSATNSSDGLASFSSYGSWVDLSAPGQGILSTVPGGDYASWSGTSMATPVVAGAAGLAFSAGLGSASAVRAALEAGVVDLGTSGRDDSFGSGRIDLARLLQVETPPRVTTSSLPAGKVGVPYAATLAAADGATPYTWAIVSGALPAGLALDAATGQLTGTPSVAGTFPLTVRVTDAASGSAAKDLTLRVASAVSVDLSGSWPSVSSSTRRRVTTATGSFLLRATGGNVTSRFTVRFSLVDAAGAVRSTRTVTVSGLRSARPVRLSVSWNGAARGMMLRAEIDPAGQIAEANESNNTAETPIP